MQYHHHDDWATEPEAGTPLDETLLGSTSGESFPFSEELKALEDSLALNLEEGLDAYRQHQAAANVEEASASVESLDEESVWDELARQVAGHVVNYMAETSMQAELDRSYALVERLYDDNRTMATQVQRLREENEQLRQDLSAKEQDLSRYHHLKANFYLKF